MNEFCTRSLNGRTLIRLTPETDSTVLQIQCRRWGLEECTRAVLLHVYAAASLSCTGARKVATTPEPPLPAVMYVCVCV